jgi:YbgC/YbaW family acyl-CoA thioester hydrolase
VTEFCIRRRVQFHETDAAGIVHFSCFFRYMEEGEHALWRSAGLTIFRPHEEIGWPRVAASFDYRRPLRFDDEFEICMRVVAVTNRTIRYECVLRQGEDEIARGSLTVACVAKLPREPMRAIDIPPAIAAHFRGLVENAAS